MSETQKALFLKKVEERRAKEKDMIERIKKGELLDEFDEDKKKNYMPKDDESLGYWFNQTIFFLFLGAIFTMLQEVKLAPSYEEIFRLFAEKAEGLYGNV